MSAQLTQLRRILATAQEVQTICPVYRHSAQNKQSSLSPRPTWPSPESCCSLSSQLWTDQHTPQLKSQVYKTLLGHVVKLQQAIMAAFDQIMEGFIPVESPYMDEAAIRLRICQWAENTFHARLADFKELVTRAIQRSSQDIKKTAGFSQDSVEVLEAAFARSQSLSQRECSIVAQAAGITHQQVRTWFQNRRNRKTKGRRTASTSALPTQPADQGIPATRRVISLPKRATKTASSVTPTPASVAGNNGRVIRRLPKRGAQVTPVKVVSPTSSLSSISTVGSIPAAGGFTSPMNQSNGCQPTISFGGSTVPYIQTTPNQYAEYDQTQSGPSLNLVPPTPGHDWYTQGNFSQSPVEMTPSSEFPSFQLAMGSGNTVRVDESAIDPTLAHTPSWSSPTNSDWSNFSFSQGSDPTPEQYSKFRLDEMVAKSEEEMLFQLKEWLDTSFEDDATPASMEMGGELDIDFSSDILDGILEQNTDVGMFDFDNAMELAAMEGEPQPLPTSLSGRSTPSLVNSASTGDLSTQASTESFSYQSVGYPTIAVYPAPVAAASGSIIDPSLLGQSSHLAQSATTSAQIPSQAVAQAVESSGWAQGALPFDDFGYKVDQGASQGNGWSEGQDLVNGWDQRMTTTA